MKLENILWPGEASSCIWSWAHPWIKDCSTWSSRTQNLLNGKKVLEIIIIGFQKRYFKNQIKVSNTLKTVSLDVLLITFYRPHLQEMITLLWSRRYTVKILTMAASLKLFFSVSIFKLNILCFFFLYFQPWSNHASQETVPLIACCFTKYSKHQWELFFKYVVPSKCFIYSHKLSPSII